MSQFLESVMCLASEGCDGSHSSGNEAVPPSVGSGTTWGVCSLLRCWWLSSLVDWHKCMSRCGSSSPSACPSAELWCNDHLCLWRVKDQVVVPVPLSQM